MGFRHPHTIQQSNAILEPFPLQQSTSSILHPTRYFAISNRPNGGIAAGRITELTGLEASGKSLVGAQLIATTQKRGGVAVLIDTENAVNDEFFQAVGVDMKKLVYVQHDTVEDIFDSIVNIIEKV